MHALIALSVALLLWPPMETASIDRSSAIRPHDNRGKVESDSICRSNSRAPVEEGGFHPWPQQQATLSLKYSIRDSVGTLLYMDVN